MFLVYVMTSSLFTERNQEFFVEDGHKYVFHKMSKVDVTLGFWMCHAKNGNNKCPACIHVKNGEVTKRIHQHNHASSPTSIAVTRIRNTIKRRAIETQEASF